MDQMAIRLNNISTNLDHPLVSRAKIRSGPQHPKGTNGYIEWEIDTNENTHEAEWHFEKECVAPYPEISS